MLDASAICANVQKNVLPSGILNVAGKMYRCLCLLETCLRVRKMHSILAINTGKLRIRDQFVTKSVTGRISATKKVSCQIRPFYHISFLSVICID